MPVQTTATSRLQLKQIGYNQEADTWGDSEATTKQKIDDAIAGVVSININGLTAYTLNRTQYASDEFTNRVIAFTGTLGSACTVTVPAVQKTTIWANNTSGGQNVVLLVQGTSNTYTLSPASRYELVCDGGQLFDHVNTIGGSLVVQGTLSASSITAGGGILAVTVGGTGAVDAAGAYANLTPPGVIHAYAGATQPNGWLLCQGQQVSRSTYANLFAVIATTFGAGDGVSTFNLPDLRGRSLLGAGAGTGLTTRTVGGTGGAEQTNITVGNVPAHTHTGNTGNNSADHTHSGVTGTENQQHTHTLSPASANSGQGASSGGSNVGATGSMTTGTESVQHTHNFTTGGTSTNHTHAFTTDATGGNAPLSLMNPFLVANWIIKY